MPSPVEIRPAVLCPKRRPAPPVARITDLAGILIAQVRAARDRVTPVALPRVIPAEGGIDAAARRAGITAQRVGLADNRSIGRLARLYGRAHARRAAAHDQHIVL